MRRVAALAITFCDRLMFDLRRCKFIFQFHMAVETDFAGLALHFLRELRFVTGRAIALRVGRMDLHDRPRGRRGRKGSGLAGGVGRHNDSHYGGSGSIRRPRLRHAIKEYIQPLLLGFRATTDHQQHAQQKPAHREGTNPARTEIDLAS